MKLERELRLRQPITSLNHETLLTLVRTAALIQKLSDRFFARFGVTDAQFNILALLSQEGDAGLSQQELSHKLVVTKSNMVGLVDRLEKAGHVARRPHPTDRRFNQIVLTPAGRRLLGEVEKPYYEEVDRLMSVLSDAQKRTVVGSLNRLRQSIHERAE